MAGLVGVPARERAGRPVPAISLSKARHCHSDRDRRDKPGDDEGRQIDLIGNRCRVALGDSERRPDK